MNVSFQGINVGEEECYPSTYKGYFSGFQYTGHINENNIPIGSAKFINVTNGNRCGFDLAFTLESQKDSNNNPVFGEGTLIYTIPIDYRDNNYAGLGHKNIFPETQQTISDGSGNCTISKNNVGPYTANLTDPSTPNTFPALANVVQVYNTAIKHLP